MLAVITLGAVARVATRTTGDANLIAPVAPDRSSGPGRP